MSTRVLASIALAFGAVAIGAVIAGCGAPLAAIDDALDPTVAAKLAKCREELRAAKDAGATPQGAFDTYSACKKREGVDQ